MAEPAAPPLRRRQLVDHGKTHVLDRDHHELGDAIAPVNLVVRRRVGVEQRHRQLAPVARVDQARRVHDGHPVPRRQPAPGQHQAGVPLGNGDGDARRHHGPPAAGGEHHARTGHQVGAGIARAGVGRQGKVGVEAEDGKLGHGAGQPTIGPMLAWMDLEMTGLDADRDVILEIAVLVTDDDLTIVAEGPDLVVHAPKEALDAMEQVVVKMHADSGLRVAVEASTLSVEQAGVAVLEFLRKHVPEARTVPLCGNSIATDRRFLARYLPEVDNWFHYRSIDVSTVKELCRRWYPEAYRAAPDKAGGHRAMDDIRESVAELAYYRTAIFMAPAPTAPPE